MFRVLLLALPRLDGDDQEDSKGDREDSGGEIVDHGSEPHLAGHLDAQRSDGGDEGRHNQWYDDRLQHSEEELADELDVHSFSH